MILTRPRNGALGCCEDGKELGLRCMSLREGTFSPSGAFESDTNLFSVCLARGRSYTVPSTTLIENCDRWHLSNIADPRDGPMSSVAVLRRDLVGALPSLKIHQRCPYQAINSILTISGWTIPEC